MLTFVTPKFDRPLEMFSHPYWGSKRNYLYLSNEEALSIRYNRLMDDPLLSFVHSLAFMSVVLLYVRADFIPMINDGSASCTLLRRLEGWPYNIQKGRQR